LVDTFGRYIQDPNSPSLIITIELKKNNNNNLDCIPDDVDYDQSVFVEQEFGIIIIHSQEL